MTLMTAGPRHRWLTLGVCAAVVAVAAPSVTAQERAATSRTATIEQAKAEKTSQLRPYAPNKVEAALDRAEDILISGRLHWHPFFESAYAGGGFTLGAGYRRFVSPYNTVDLRGSITFSGYKRIEAEFRAPRLFGRRGVLSAVGGWREAPSVGFYGIGTGPTSVDDRANYAFTQPYASATLDFWPTRRLFVLRGGVEFSEWTQEAGGGTAPSVDEVYTPTTLPGLGASPTYLHTQGMVGLDWRTSPGYTRRGGFYGVTAHRFVDQDDLFGFTQVDYEAIQHVPILRDTWVISLRGRVETTYVDDNDQVPFFMLPALGGGSSLRGFASWRFRDRNSLLLQAEWRILANRFLDMALFVDAGKVTASASDLNNFHDLKQDYGLGFRLHGPLATPLRIELAKSNEGLALVFSSKAPF
jgi:hypothetical protein